MPSDPGAVYDLDVFKLYEFRELRINSHLYLSTETNQIFFFTLSLGA